jgi:triosephosphate isomerase
MNTGRLEARDLAAGVSTNVPETVDVAICPPFPWLRDVREIIDVTRVELGAQNCWHERSGAFTGEVSPTMLAELCDLVIVGHSERRQIIGETDKLIAAKAKAVLAENLNLVLCVGENLETRRSGHAVQFVRGQLETAFRELDPATLVRCVIAYEPIWAIGTGVAAEPADAQEMSASIRQFVSTLDQHLAESMRILYGGSVSPDNAYDILSQTDVDGALVGGASLKVDSFNGIVEAAARCE